MLFKEWLSDFIVGKEEVTSFAPSNHDSIFSNRRFVDKDGRIWEIAFTYTGRVVVRSGLKDRDTFHWTDWVTQHDIEVRQTRNGLNENPEPGK